MSVRRLPVEGRASTTLRPELVAGTRTWRVPRAHVEDVATDPRRHAEMPELFTHAFVSIDRYL
jgi:hypothetical protein